MLVEKQLAARGEDRHALGRDKFVAEVESFREEKGGVILEQLQQLGASLDWSRTQFTMSPEFRTAVNTAFIRLMEAGLLYRAERLVNWCPQLGSAISDMEVTHVEVSPGQMFDVPGWDRPVQLGVMVDIAYKVVGSDQEVVVSTTRPETMLGDTAVAVHPEDARYRHLQGARLWHPFRQCSIPLVADTSVSPDLGTGALKITPAHDHRDWEVAARHGLEAVSVMDDAGRMVTREGDSFHGMGRWEAREAVCARLAELGLLRGTREHAMVTPVCHRTGDIIEPRLKPQWFLRTEKLAELACRAVTDRDLVLDPADFKSVWLQFLGEERQQDWCVSRQIWWGHRVPVFWSTAAGGHEAWVGAQDEAEARLKAAAMFGCAAGEVSVAQDTDVLDTWFSSALYPFVAFGWPEQTADLDRFYPLNLLETGHDILFFWVGRMVMLGVALTSKLPFSDVMLHGVVSDSQGRKMSKSLGNVVDPLHLIHGASMETLQTNLIDSFSKGSISREEMELSMAEMTKDFPDGIPRHGVDAVRWGLLTYDVKQRQINLNLTVLNSAGAWCNKVWQLARFLHLAHEKIRGGDTENLPKNFQPGLMDMWVLSQLAQAVRNINEGFEQREVNVVTRELRKFIYTDVCDTYIEYIKPNLSDASNPEFLPSLLILHSCVMTSLKLLHPVMPFITEELYQRLPRLPKEKRRESIMIDSYPVATDWNSFLNEALSEVIDSSLSIVTGVRSVRKRYNLDKDAEPDIIVCGGNPALPQCEEVIQRLGKCGAVHFSEDTIDPSSLPYGYSQYSCDGGVTIYVEVGSHMDIDQEISKIDAKIEKVEKSRIKLNKTLKGKFKYRNSPEKVASQHAEYDEVVKQLNEQKQILQSLKSKQ